MAVLRERVHVYRKQHLHTLGKYCQQIQQQTYCILILSAVAILITPCRFFFFLLIHIVYYYQFIFNSRTQCDINLALERITIEKKNTLLSHVSSYTLHTSVINKHSHILMHGIIYIQYS